MMASDKNSSDPAPECQTMASDQNSSDPAPECQIMELNHDSLSLAIQRQAKVTQTNRTVTTSNELDLLFSSMFDELLNGSSKVVSKSSANINQAETYAENDQITDDEFINIFSNPVQDQGETSTRHLADLFTKALPVERFQYLVKRLGMRCLTPAELEALVNEPV
nr:ribonuclease H-like domain-containing protein [Tanacetum cinerariifolium]